MDIGDITVKLRADIDDYLKNMEKAKEAINNFSDASEGTGDINDEMTKTSWIPTWISGIVDLIDVFGTLNTTQKDTLSYSKQFASEANSGSFTQTSASIQTLSESYRELGETNKAFVFSANTDGITKAKDDVDDLKGSIEDFTGSAKVIDIDPKTGNVIEPSVAANKPSTALVPLDPNSKLIPAEVKTGGITDARAGVLSLETSLKDATLSNKAFASSFESTTIASETKALRENELVQREVIQTCSGMPLLFVGMSSALEGLGATIMALAAPIAIIVVALVAVTAALLYLWNTNKGFRDAMIGIWNQIVGSLQAAVATVLPTLTELSTDLIATVNAWWPVIGPILTILVTGFGLAFTQMATVVGGALSIIIQIIGWLIDTVANMVGIVLALMRGDWSDAWNHFLKIGQDTINTFLGILGTIGSTIANVFLNSANILINSGLFDAFKSQVQPIINWINEKINWINGLHLPGLNLSNISVDNSSSTASASTTSSSSNTSSSGTARHSGGACFIGGTGITLSDGTTKPIEEITEGDMVLSFDPDTLELLSANVESTLHRLADEIYHFTFEDGRAVSVTGEHPFYVKEVPGDVTPVHKTFLRAKDLRVGQKIYVAAGRAVRESKVLAISKSFDPVEVYNFNVVPTHTYIANGCLVHNVKMMAEGGIVTGPTFAMIGEAGPEAVIPLKNLKSNSSEVNVHVYLDGKELTNTIGQRMVREIRSSRC